MILCFIELARVASQALGKCLSLKQATCNEHARNSDIFTKSGGTLRSLLNSPNQKNLRISDCYTDFAPCTSSSKSSQAIDDDLFKIQLLVNNNLDLILDSQYGQVIDLIPQRIFGLFACFRSRNQEVTLSLQVWQWRRYWTRPHFGWTWPLLWYTDEQIRTAYGRCRHDQR